VSRSAIAKKFGILVRRLRMKAELSQEEFAHQCGLHRTYIGAIERGEKTVTIDTANKLAKALNTPLSQLFHDLEIE
jgi:transcriptional regulator with XRE-family HTH domain